MGGRYKAYPEYKDSGVEWLGDVPQDWIVCRIKNAAMLNASKSEVRNLPADLQVSFIPMEAIGERGELDTSRTKCLSEVLAGYTYIADGDLMIAKITPCFENGKGAVAAGLTNGIGFATTEVISIRPLRAADCKFFYYLLNCNPFKFMAESSMYGAGGQKRVADSFVAEYHFAFPPKNGRLDIANFLGHETAKIDTLIEKQQQLIQLLKEKRQAVISHAVTKGLNSNAKMRDSGVEWLGEVPEHWGASRLKYVTSRIVDCPHETPVYNIEGDYLIVRTADVDQGDLKIEQMYRVEQDQYQLRTRREKLEENDIVYGREGERWGHAALVPAPDRFALGQRMMQFRSLESFCARFLMYQLNSVSVYRQGEIDTVGATSPHVNVATIRNYRLTVPPVFEQRKIAEYLEKAVDRFDKLVLKAASTALLLNERRTALISAAVTGKIDVRDWVPPMADHRSEEAA